MSTPDTDWNPDDGPPPTDDERRDAARLADALDRPTPPAVLAPDTATLLAVVGRVRATVHPDEHANRAAAERAVQRALHATAPPPRLARWNPSRVRLAAAAALLLVVGIGSGAYVRTRSHHTTHAASSVFDAPIEPGAGSAPVTRLYNHGLRGYRDALLGGSQ